MNNILIYSGTTEGKALAYRLAHNTIPSIVSVATEYGELVMDDNQYITVYKGRMTSFEMEEFMKVHEIKIVVDATHPFATEVTENIKKSIIGSDVKYIRLKRGNDKSLNSDERLNKYFDSVDECVQALKDMECNILLTTGSKELRAFCKEELIDKLYVRVLPMVKSIEICEANGIKGRQIIAMQGPFSKNMNAEIIRQYNIGCIVTKESGQNSGYFEKLQAAKQEKIPAFVIRNQKKDEEGYDLEEVYKILEQLLK